VRKSRLGARTAVMVAAVGAALFGFSTAASASALIYQANNVNVKISGGEVTAMNVCINDAQDGIVTQINECTQVASAGNLLQLEDVSIWVFPAFGPPWPLFEDRNVTAEVTGGLASAINVCANDALDGFIVQANACTQAASVGNLVNMTRVSVSVFE
jgi:hypothetical protein